MPALSVVRLVKSYGSGGRQAPTRALNEVDLQVDAGTAFGLIGPNGAGKTTLLKTLLGVVAPTTGSVSVFGRDPSDPEVRRRIGYLPERQHVMGAWKPLAYLASVARLKGLASVSDATSMQLERVGLWSVRDQKIGTFSKGMRQRLGLAAALLGSPDLLILDEPTDGIDPKGRADVRAILQQERARGATLFLNSHLLTETERICDRVGILVGGRLLRTGSMAELCVERSRWSLRFVPGVDRALLEEVGFVATDEPSTFRCDDCEPPELNRRLTLAQQAGALLVELSAQTRSLEAVLLELMERPDE